MEVWGNDLPGHCYHPLGVAQEDAGSDCSSLGSLEGTLSQTLSRVTLHSSDTENPVSVAKQRKSVLGCLQPREVSPELVSRKALKSHGK